MKVSITPGVSTKGLIFKKEQQTVTFSVQFNEEELAKIEHSNLFKKPVLEAPIRPNFALDLTVGSFMENRKWTCTFDRADYAQGFTNVLKNALTNMKDYIDAIDEEPQAQEFEL